MKRGIFWLAALCFLLATAAVGRTFFDLPGNSAGELAIYIFLGYCAIIVVSQLFSCLMGLRSVMEQWTEKRRVSRRVALR